MADDLEYEVDVMVRDSDGIESDPITDPEADQGASDAPDHAIDDAMAEIIDLVGSKDQQVASNDGYQDELDLLDNMALAALDKVGQEVHASAAKLVQNHMSRDFRKGANGSLGESASSTLDTSNSLKVIEKMKEYPVPANLTVLKPCRVNESMFKASTPLTKKINSEAQLAEAAVCKAQVVNSLLIESLISMKTHVSPEGRKCLQSVLTLVGNNVEFLALARAKVNESRRECILSAVNPNYKRLGANTSPSDGLLFGKDLEGAMKTVETSNKLAQKLTKQNRSQLSTRGSFLGRGRGRGSNPRGYRKYHPYPLERGYQSQSHADPKSQPR
jgi:hypothetical protein